MLIERLLDAGLRVLALHPNQVAAARARFRVSGGKSDRFDAFVLCELARTDHHRFRVLEPDTDETKALRALTRAREDLVQARVALGNQLRAELERFWPGPIGLFSDLDSPISLAFLARYPSPIDARGLGEQRLTRSLTAITTRAQAAERPAREAQERARGTRGRARDQSSPRGRAHARRRHRPAGRTDQRARAHRSPTRSASTPTARSSCRCSSPPQSVICAATMLAEIGDCRARYPNRDALAGDAGQAAVAVESGKRKVARFRWGCDKRLRGAFHTLANSTRHWHPWAADHYARARARGHDHQRAIRTLGRAWSRIVWRCWQDRTPYDPARHRGLQQHIAVTIPSSPSHRLDLTATQRMAGAAVTEQAAQQAEREALDGKPPSAIPSQS